MIELLAGELAATAEQGRPLDPLAARFPDLDPAGACAVQRALVRRWTDAGNRVVGHGMELTPAVVQDQLAVGQPASRVLSGIG